MWYVKPKDELYHHGIKGQKWGVRRFQNEDGSYTEAGRKRYGDDERSGSSNGKSRKSLSDKQKKALKIGAAVTASALVAVGGYALYKSGKLDKAVERGKLAYMAAKARWDNYKGPVEGLREVAAGLDDQDLANAVKRNNLENAYVKSYTQRFNDPKESRFDKASSALKTAASVAGTAKAIQEILRKDGGSGQKQNPDPSNMSDQELRERVNRANLENQYRNTYGNRSASQSKKGKAEKAIDVGNKAIDIAKNVEDLNKQRRKRR